MKTKLLSVCILLCAIANSQTNYALNFNGSSDYVDLGNAAGSNIRSIELWFKPTSNISSSISVQSYVLVGRDDATQLHEYGLYIKGVEYPAAQRGQLTFYISDNGNYYYALSNNSSWAAGTWYHACGTIDPVNGMKLYVNGVLQATTDPYTTAIPSASEITAIGKWGNSSIRYFPGRIDEVRFWNRSLSQSEIQQKMCYWLNPANETGLVGYWKMNEGSGSTIFDATTSANNGVVIGATFVQDSNCFIGTIGIAPLVTQSYISIYPNPFSSTTTLTVSTDFNEMTLTIFNQLGQQVKEMKNYSGQTITLQRDNLPSGLYFIRLTKDNNVIATKKLLITD